MTEISHLIKQRAFEIGFDLVGITLAEDLAYYHNYKQWIENDFHGKMNYLSNNIEKRKNVKTLMPSAKSVISCGINYFFPSSGNDFIHSLISNYARNKDYHKIIEKMLKELKLFILQLIPNAEIKIFCDTAPILEKAYAENAGIGWIGKNTCLINKKLGSYIFIGEIICSISLKVDSQVQNYCGTCTKCIDACPTKAIIEPYKLDARKCISYLTIELKDAIPEAIRNSIGQHIFGCDICQSVCPWNRKIPITQNQDFCINDELKNKNLSYWLSLSEDDFNLIFLKSPIKRSKWQGFIRNVVVAAGNSGNKDYINLLNKLILKTNPLLTEHILWALKKLY